jgi:hypothetical protein
MLWVDSDGFCTKKWAQDPIATLIRNNLAVFFANFPQGRSKCTEFHERFMQAFNRSVRVVGIEDGHLYAKEEGVCVKSGEIPQIHGFMHVTDLDFIAVNRAWNGTGHWLETRSLAENLTTKLEFMPANGIELDIYHNGYLDGQKNKHSGCGGFVKWWRRQMWNNRCQLTKKR